MPEEAEAPPPPPSVPLHFVHYSGGMGITYYLQSFGTLERIIINKNLFLPIRSGVRSVQPGLTYDNVPLSAWRYSLIV